MVVEHLGAHSIVLWKQRCREQGPVAPDCQCPLRLLPMCFQDMHFTRSALQTEV